MSTISWSTYIISHGGHCDTIRYCQPMIKASMNVWFRQLKTR